MFTRITLGFICPSSTKRGVYLTHSWVPVAKLQGQYKDKHFSLTPWDSIEAPFQALTNMINYPFLLNIPSMKQFRSLGAACRDKHFLSPCLTSIEGNLCECVICIMFTC